MPNAVRRLGKFRGIPFFLMILEDALVYWVIVLSPIFLSMQTARSSRSRRVRQSPNAIALLVEPLMLEKAMQTASPSGIMNVALEARLFHRYKKDTTLSFGFCIKFISSTNDGR